MHLNCRPIEGTDQYRSCVIFNRPCTSTIKHSELCEAGRPALLVPWPATTRVEHVQGDIEFAWYGEADSDIEDEGQEPEAEDDDEEEMLVEGEREDVGMEDA